MAITPFLAMTAAEMGKVSEFPPRIAWMACHFSPYGLGLSNVPVRLSPQSLILLDDITPIRGHDPELIADQLMDCIQRLRPCGILLDFQRPDNTETAALVKHLAQSLPCPVIVSEIYAQDVTCPIFLPSLSPSVPLEEYIFPWIGRDIWLEISPSSESLTLTEQGCKRESIPCPDHRTNGFAEKSLNCHYTIEVKNKSARFILWRTRDDLTQFMEDAHKLGITGFVGLYQEFSQF